MADQAKLGGKPSDDTNFAMIRDGVASYLSDSDPEETNEWMDSLDGLLQESSPERARYLMLRLLEQAKLDGYQQISLSCDPTNNTALHLYQKLGFKKVGIHTNKNWIMGKLFI